MLDDNLKFYAIPAWPPMYLEVKVTNLKIISLKFLVNVFSTFLLWKQLSQIVGRTSASLVTLTCRSWSECQHDPYFTIQWFCLISWKLFDLWISLIKIMSQYDPTFDLKINVSHYISWSSDFALYLQDYLIYEHHTLELWVCMTPHLTSK